MTELRICFVGDSITNGTGDDECLGWPGRLCGTERKQGHDITSYNLGIRAETSEQIASRWQTECAPRLPEPYPAALVFSFGVNDMAEENGALRVSKERSLATAKQMISDARDWLPVLWVGPAPINDEKQPFSPGPDRSYSFSTDRLVDLSAAYSRQAKELNVPYLDLMAPLLDDDQWNSALRAGDGVHPTGPGYAVMANLIGAWPAWRAWLD